MIPKIQARGKSFKALATYLTHNAKEAESSERVAWTHTLNLAHDHVPSAVDEMMWTARAAELLKQEAGIRGGGRATANPVKHFSLNWGIGEEPTREEMIEATQSFLNHMKWDEHQAVLVAHEDKEYAHVHGMLNAVHPETGLRLDESFEHRRAQAWALEYERAQGRIQCEQRLKNPEEREDAPTRPAWLAFQEKQREFERDEKSRRAQEPILVGDLKKPENIPADEWRKLKEIQKNERLEFFADGKSAFKELRLGIYREVRAEFRERWADLYAQRESADPAAFATAKAELVAEQKAVLETRRDEACQALRDSRDGLYRELLADQREMRLGLRSRQEMGLDNALFLQNVEDGNAAKDRTDNFREAGEAATNRQERSASNTPEEAYSGAPRSDNAGMKSGTDVGAGLATGLGFGVLSFFDSLADGLIAAKPDPRPRPKEPEPAGPTLFDVAAEDARKRQQHSDQEESDRKWRGTRPATPRSLAHPANKICDRPESRSGIRAVGKFGSATTSEVTRRRIARPVPDRFDEYEGVEADIEATYRRKLAGLRRLPRSQRAYALQAARESRLLDLKSLREKRASVRHARRRLRQLQRPAPS